MTKFNEGDRVVDRDGRDWIVRDVVHHDGSHWYNVRRSQYGKCYDAVRFEQELRQ